MPAEYHNPAADTSEPAATPPKSRRRGFAGMDPERVKAIASKGGKAAHAAGTAHTFDTEEARRAGVKGGKAPHVRRGRGPKRDPKPLPEDRQEKLPLSGDS